MCLILLASNCHPRYQLIIAANRDEFYKRPTLQAGFWRENPDILAGKDVKEGGTWMGITTSGRFASLTNYRDPAGFKRGAPSRGHLVKEFLQTSTQPTAFLRSIPEGGQAYNGFNLLLGTYEALFFYSNREKNIHRVTDGVHGLSNSLLDVPWPKVKKGTKALKEALQGDEINVNYLFNILADNQQAEDKDLPQTGVGLEMERWLSPLFIKSPDYGTRTSTIILIDKSKKVRFWERSFAVGPTCKSTEVSYEFEIKHVNTG